MHGGKFGNTSDTKTDQLLGTYEKDLLILARSQTGGFSTRAYFASVSAGQFHRIYIASVITLQFCDFLLKSFIRNGKTLLVYTIEEVLIGPPQTSVALWTAFSFKSGFGLRKPMITLKILCAGWRFLFPFIFHLHQVLTHSVP
ncbi:hypothetical protein Bpfe_006699 [Biomphalaria pfeifferi]|uniref:Uncharacterized protein n=1 Tax=Biomphalaria pfeifferi TaxID=112525 RepID=A0AAD8C246_BIOPF|nr:hypothetical protein Bpfe_006699 [Biomphalaria pfeifferi]